MENNSIRLTKLSLANIGKFETFTLEPDATWTELHGENAQGKTTIAQALASVFEGGNPSHLIRDGAESGTIVLDFSNGMHITKLLNAKGAQLKATRPDVGAMPTPQSMLKRASDEWSINPSRILNAKGPERVAYFLSKLPMEFPEGSVEAIVVPGMTIPSGHPLKVLPVLRKEIMRRRLEKKTLLDDKVASYEALEATLPKESPASIETEAGQLRSELSQAEALLAESLTSLKASHDSANTSLDGDLTEFVRGGEKQLADEIEALRNAWREKESAERTRVASMMTTNDSTFLSESDRIRQRLQPDIDSIRVRVSALDERLQQEGRNKQTRELALKQRTEAAALTAAWGDLDKRVQSLDALRESLVADLPIEGLSIQDDDLAYNGLPWDTSVNTARKIEIIFQMARMTAGDIPIVFFDGLESLDSKNLALFREAAQHSGCQHIVTIVDDGPLRLVA